MTIDITLLAEARQEIYKYYRLDFMPDGTPGKRIGEQVVFHPILAPYLICDFLDQYEKNGKGEGLTQAVEVAERAIPQAEPFECDSLVYWYDPSSQLSSIPKKFYSGLTQAWYVKAFARLAKLDSRYEPLVGKFFRSLAVPIGKGGPLLKRDFGWVVEEYPYEPPLYTLNGWLTVLRLLLDHQDSLVKFDGVQEFIERNLDAVEYLLPLYDVPGIANSRYQLTGFTRLKLVLARHASVHVKKLQLTIPGEGVAPWEPGSVVSGRWGNYVERIQGRIVQFNLMLSLVSYPKKNVLNLEIDSDTLTKTAVMLADGDYDPLISGLPTKRWRPVGEVLLNKGENRLQIELPWDELNLFAYPTNFKKQLKGAEGKRFNAYHFVHIIDLAVLYHFTGRRLFKDFAERWSQYVERWPSLDFLQDQKIYSHAHYSGQDFFANVKKYLTK